MTQIHTIQSTINYIKTELQFIYASREIESISSILLENILKYSKIQIQLSRNEKINSLQFDQIQACVEELKSHKPIQYILGETEFYDLRFKVNQHTLIPRPETEELVHTILKENPDLNLKVLDIGTGSGCIPICLAKNLNQAIVSSVDISAEAIEMAIENAKINEVQVAFLNRDILNWKDFEWDDFDLIVSNPPYVRNSEKERMDANVLNFEPHTALFVSDQDPLLFYRTIADFALCHLKEKGKLYFEINENLGLEMKDLLKEKGFSEIYLMKDINGKDRMISATKTK